MEASQYPDYADKPATHNALEIVVITRLTDKLLGGNFRSVDRKLYDFRIGKIDTIFSFLRDMHRIEVPEDVLDLPLKTIIDSYIEYKTRGVFKCFEDLYEAILAVWKLRDKSNLFVQKYTNFTAILNDLRVYPLLDQEITRLENI